MLHIRGRHSGRAVFLDRESRNPYVDGHRPMLWPTPAQNSFVRWLLGPGHSASKDARERAFGSLGRGDIPYATALHRRGERVRTYGAYEVLIDGEPVTSFVRPAHIIAAAAGSAS